MSFESLLPLTMFFSLFFFLLLGFPVAFTLSGTALIFAVIGHLLDVFILSDLNFIPMRIWGIMQNFTLVAVPMFVMMGVLLEKSGVAEELFSCINKALRGRAGALSSSVVIVGALLAATTGIVGATVVTLGLLALPAMLKGNYSKEFSCGLIAASGTLGQLIPPSIVLIVLADIMGIAVGDLFAAAIGPGLLLITFYLIYGFLSQRSRFSKNELNDQPKVSLIEIVRSLFPILVLVILVLGSILFGLASPTEASGCGAVGAIIITAFKQKLSFNLLKDSLEQTVFITSMVFMLLIGAQFFGVVFRGLSGDIVIENIINQYIGSPQIVLLLIMIVVFILGFFLDFLEICFVVLPIFLPILKATNYDLLWVAVLIAINLQTSFLTPPFGFSLFYLKGVSPKEINTIDIYKGAMPFVALQLVVIVLISSFPSIALWLPKVFLK